MTKKTKRAKRVKVTWMEFPVIHFRSEYQCPYCHTIFQNTVNKKTLRFRCDCGQELIVEHILKGVKI